jgi:prepilin-type N-terminal cleavage/methylation domain-containing protein
MNGFRRQTGVTLVELLIGMVILGILLAITSAVMISTGRVANQQEQLADVGGSGRLALFRMGEIVRQAAYVYPPDATISVAGTGSFTTGPAALAVLVPAGSTYCTGSTQTYCGFIYAAVDRQQFVPPLPERGGTDQALAEIRVEGIEWAKNRVPAGDLTAWPAGSSGLLADGIDSARSNLGGDMRVSVIEAIYDDSTIFSNDPANITSSSLINGADISVSLRRLSASGGATAEQRLEVFSRSVPRSAPPNLQ